MARIQALHDRFNRLPARSKQWAMLLSIGLVCFLLLWGVLEFSASNAGPKTPRRTEKSTFTHVDGLMAPGAGVSAQDTWVATAGKDLAAYKQERDQQAKVNRELVEKLAAQTARLADLEGKVKAQAAVDAAAAPKPAAAASAPAPAPTTATRQTPPPTYPPSRLPVASTSPSIAGSNLGAFGAPPGANTGPASAGPDRPMLLKVQVSKAPTEGKTDPARPRGSDRTVDNFLPVSFTRGELLGGLDAPTGGQAQTNPHPILIRLSDNSVLPNKHRAAYRECFVVAAGYGDISSERAYLRTESLSCVDDAGNVLELKIQGSVYGEDGKVGMRGRLVTKQGQMLANALLAGVASGIGKGLAAASTTTTQSAFGTIATQGSGKDALQAGVGTGIGSALDRLANYYIKLAEQTFPVIEIDAGRQIDVVITKGSRLDGSDASRLAQALPGVAANVPVPTARRQEPAIRRVNGGDED